METILSLVVNGKNMIKKGFKKQACYRIYLKIREHANFMHYQSFLHKNLQNHGRCSADYKERS